MVKIKIFERSFDDEQNWEKVHEFYSSKFDDGDFQFMKILCELPFVNRIEINLYSLSDHD